ncbi:MAG: hypothetical protein MPL62_18435 [Alphaproteobacteria bacterium]|nr:hypothetical protein [Alphaproteobacteria bacterium]
MFISIALIPLIGFFRPESCRFAADVTVAADAGIVLVPDPGLTVSIAYR